MMTMMMTTTARDNTIELQTAYRDIRKKTQKSSLRLPAPLRTLSNRRYINLCTHSFIHSVSIRATQCW